MNPLARTLCVVAAGIGLLLTGCTSNAPIATPATAARPSTPHASAPATPSPSPAAPTASSRIQHIVVIVEENKPAASIVGNPSAPYVNGLVSRSAMAPHYSAITHPSLPNYLAMTSGTTAGIDTDCNPPGGRCLVTTPNITDELQRAGLSWRMYAESMPSPCFTGNTTTYAVKHNPFLYFPSVTRDAARCAQHDVPFDRFAGDLATASSLPAFSFISPNLCNDMHDCSIATGDAWLKREVPQILGSPAFTSQRSLLVITFDEGDSGDNVVACLFAGPAARSGYTSPTAYTHYSLLRTVEDVWGLAPLNAGDGAAQPMRDLLR